MLFYWMLAMIIIVLFPLYMWKKGMIRTQKDFMMVLFGLSTIGMISLIGILSGN